MPPLLTEVFEVLEGPEFSGLWPEDGKEKKRKHIEFCFKSGLLTPLCDPQGRLAGFLLYYRGPFLDGIYKNRPDDGGEFIVCTVLWVRPDLRGGQTIKNLISKAVTENREKILGAEKISFERIQRGNGDRVYNFPKFFRRYFRYGKRRRDGNDTESIGTAIDDRHGPEYHRQFEATGPA